MDTVLIVDDSSFIVEGLIAFLKKKYRPLAAYSGEECLEILKRETPSVIILDIMMEPMDGWETLARIKENTATRHIPVLMFSALKISPEEAEEHRISIEDCLTKPVSPNRIIEAIEKVLSRRDTHRMVTERWQSAGIRQEKIDEYLTLAMDLEVDLSLCQNMKVQYDLGHPEDQNRAEFQAVISAVGDRILQERDQIETLAREMNELLARGNGIRDPAAQFSLLPEAEEPLTMPSSPAVSSEENTSGEDSAVSPAEVPVTQEPGSPLLIPEPEVQSVPEQLVAPGAGTVPPGSDGILEQGTPVSDEPAGDPAGEPESLPSVNGPAGQGEYERTEPEGSPVPTPLPADPAPAPRDLPASTLRNVIPASLDVPPKTPGISSGHGGGTDVPMPWDSGRGRKSGTAIPAQANAGVPEKPDAPQPAPGILGRILSLVRSLLGRRT